MTIANKIIPKGTKVVFRAFACAGAETYEAYILDSDYTEEDLSKEAWYFGVAFAESYDIYPYNDYKDISNEELEAEGIDLNDNCYSDHIEGWYELYDAEKHDGHLTFGNNQGFSWNHI